MNANRRQVSPPRVRKAARVMIRRDRTAAWFQGAGSGAAFTAEAAAVCAGPACPVEAVHEAPHPHGRCGFHGADSGIGDWLGPETVLLDVEQYGRIIRHADGWRAGNQRVLGVQLLRGCVECGAAVDDPVLTTVPASPESDGVPVVPRCRPCADAWWAPGREPIALADLAGLLVTEVSWADSHLTEQVLSRHEDASEVPGH